MVSGPGQGSASPVRPPVLRAAKSSGHEVAVEIELREGYAALENI